MPYNNLYRSLGSQDSNTNVSQIIITRPRLLRPKLIRWLLMGWTT